ncbi:MAG: hypothetical protein OEY27_06430 [Gammaproteobacteria bacterium]|nr:hypothetical protein [Gammaproteobacteria bacterium]
MVESTGEPAPKSPVADSTDAVWASFLVSFPPDITQLYCRDVEAVFRINPYYYFDVWNQTGPGTYHAEFENQSNKTRQSLELNVLPGPGRGLTVTYTGGIKKRTVFTIEPAPEGSRLTVTDDYDLLPPAERENRKSEVDKSLNAWAEALRIYFLRLKRWSWLPGWNWYLRRVWIPMKPSARRIVWLLYLITVAEFFFFLFVVLIYVLEQD